MNERTEVGDVQQDRDGAWVVTAATGSGVSRVRVGSLAHRVLAATDARLAESLPLPERAGE